MPWKPADRREVADALRAQVTHRLDRAGVALRRGTAGVHEARKQFKKARAILRLLRGAIGNRRFRQANRAIRNAGRPLSATRDGQAMRETIATLRQLAPRAARSLTAVKLMSEPLPQQTLANVLQAIDRVRRDAETWPVEPGGWRVIRGAIRQSYRAGRRAFREASKHKTDDAAWHEARKRAKDLRYQLEFVAPLAPSAIEPIATLARAVADILGEHNDLAVVRDHATGTSHRAANALLARRLETLREDVGQLGATLYAERPAAFQRRMHAYWRSGHA